MIATCENNNFRDFSYIKRFIMQAIAFGKPLVFSLHCLKLRESEKGLFTFTLKSDLGQESWPAFVESREDALVRGNQFLNQYNCKINSELDIDEQYVEYTVNA